MNINVNNSYNINFKNNKINLKNSKRKYTTDSNDSNFTNSVNMNIKENTDNNNKNDIFSKINEEITKKKSLYNQNKLMDSLQSFQVNKEHVPKIMIIGDREHERDNKLSRLSQICVTEEDVSYSNKNNIVDKLDMNINKLKLTLGSFRENNYHSDKNSKKSGKCSTKIENNFTNNTKNTLNNNYIRPSDVDKLTNNYTNNDNYKDMNINSTTNNVEKEKELNYLKMNSNLKSPKKDEDNNTSSIINVKSSEKPTVVIYNKSDQKPFDEEIEILPDDDSLN